MHLKHKNDMFFDIFFNIMGPLGSKNFGKKQKRWDV